MGYKKKWNGKKLEEQDHIDRVVNPLLERMEKGEIPWMKPWETSTNAVGELVCGLQQSVSSGKLYEGINALITQIVAEDKGYNNRYWGTFLGIKNLDGHVKKGEKGTYVVKWDFTRAYKGDSNCSSCQGKVVYVKNGKGSPCSSCDYERTWMIPRIYSHAVWNLDQCEFANGVPEKFLPPKPVKPKKETKAQATKRINRTIKEAQAVIDGYIPVLKGGFTDEKIESNSAYYSPSRDAVVVPAKKQYPRKESYYRVAFHELVHSTGHKSRIDRFGDWTSHQFGSHDYSKEEFVAEIGACVLSSSLGCETAVDLDNSVAYLQSWKKKLKDNKKDVLYAIGQAMKAVNLILAKGKMPKKTKK